MTQSPTEAQRQDRPTGWVLLVSALIGAVAAFTLLVEKIELLKDPNYVPSCSMNPVLSCGSIMNTEQAEVLGFPNPIMGVFGFAVVLTLGAVLVWGIRLPTGIWVGLQMGATAGFVFVHWLIYQSLYVIGALCPYCMVVWVVTIVVFAATTAHWLKPAGRFTGYAPTLTVFWLLVITALIGYRFWDYWQTLLP